MRWTLPNILTIGRLIAAPGIAIIFLYFNRPFADWFALILFGSVALTDWIDGRLARAWGMETRFGAAMDPIADKAMVLVALLVIAGYSAMSPWIVMPATLIVFREVFVSGLREYVGPGAKLAVTNLAKYKTTAQMLAIAVLFSQGIFLHHLIDRTVGMSPELVESILAGTAPDEVGLRAFEAGHLWSGRIGVALLWIAAILTLVTGWDYFRKSLPALREPE
ncbi:CDP-diacylglycerol--glycerol-3-phosphate 3-phosphatidyltransferase [Oceanicola granulosus HTCC2516]|uniref:CDP-diacylglycerol--glycerol-3-phosphate 3-phosphatidyltransferase n=1 Tax=Oceanicola granulosus (strain ATCC BAA-861 / DSM 15982 / KCTC 12143 / HTCC2516) TaxID=314256 RepID=Q2CCH5_OCEGH|nr:CDP-diacylglycerol--glycerol-3-phosphate 3-phosphatidyltransferase [Oceanicola granulosus]EAR50343.1 CDP-diacylglycerol--glycerol-3-phosphate 3-phosphatidyltransferase [Oceanicola granulosus HTCC2516]